MHGLVGGNTQVEQKFKFDSIFRFGAYGKKMKGCPGGCITGGGQPRSDDPEVRMKRLKAIYGEDESRTLRQSHLNPSITEIYKEYLGKPGGHLSHELLHTHYVDRSEENE